MLNHALEYQNMGLSVIPIGPEKKPLIKWAEFQRRMATAEEIKQWWHQWPSAMVGLVTGQISRLFVVDCDTEEGFQAVQGLIPDSLELPTAQTPRGGWHFYFQNPAKSENRAAVLPGVDIRGEGGYIIAPPSVNGNGKAYRWLDGLSLFDVAPAALPASLSVSLYKNNAFKRGGTRGGNRGDVVNGDSDLTTMTTTATMTTTFFQKGTRDNDLFHAANCLIKGGAELPFVKQAVEIIAKGCTPPFPEKEIQAKIDSALQRAEKRDRDITGEIREWVLTTSGHFLTTDCLHETTMTTRQERKAAVMALLRMCEGPNPIIEKYGDKRGSYRRIENDVEPVNFLTAPTEAFPLALPLGVSDYCELYPGNIVVVAGSKGAGKTSFLLNVVKDNMRRHEIVYLNSEMGDTEFRKRLELFEDIPLNAWSFKPYHRSSNFADLITTEKKVFIVDFLEMTTDFWKVGGMIQEIFKKLRDGICLIALQKADGRDVGRGGDFSREKARLYLSLDYLQDQRVNRIKIVDAKAWKTDVNPRGMYREYKLVKGSRFMPVTAWEN